MDIVYLITIQHRGRTVFQGVSRQSESDANHLAGQLMDRLADNHGGDCFYRVDPIADLGECPLIASAHDAVEAARIKAVGG